MMPCARPPCPPELVKNAATWTSRYLARRAADPGARFSWPSVAGRPVNEILRPVLQAMTQEHCAYCDQFPLDLRTLPPWIDHFRPKARFPELAYAWTNLFAACPACQGPHGKGERWSEAAIRPDEEGYSFDRYFRYVAGTGEIEPNPQGSPADQDRATATIDLLRLNAQGLPRMRRRYAQRYKNLPEEDRPFRFATPLSE